MANSRAMFTVAGLDSAADGEEIEDELREREGVQLVDVEPGTGEVEVRHGEELISGEQIKSAIEELGYEVEDGE